MSPARVLIVCVVAVTICLPPGGCETTVVPPPEAILAGTWILTPSDFLIFSTKTLVFNTLGRLTEIRTTAGDITVTERDLDLRPTVSGSMVRIPMTSDFVFNGTLNDERNVATGRLTIEVNFFNTTITTDLGAATMARQP